MKMKFIFDDGSTSLVELQEVNYDLVTRWKRSLQIFFILFGVSIFSIFVPVLHFILVPGFLFAAFIMAFLRFQQMKFIPLSGCLCPKCQAPFTEKGLHPTKSQEWIKLYCYQCRTNMKLASFAE